MLSARGQLMSQWLTIVGSSGVSGGAVGEGVAAATAVVDVVYS